MAKILLIEDEAPLRRLASEILQRGGHEVVAAANGAEGLLFASRREFDLVITDIIMPEKEGMETIIDLRRGHPGLPVIAMSGGGRIIGNEWLNVAPKLGARAMLRKPFSGRELLAMVDTVLIPP